MLTFEMMMMAASLLQLSEVMKQTLSRASTIVAVAVVFVAWMMNSRHLIPPPRMPISSEQW
jgi:sulfite exporter TauE/SafE